MTFYSTFLSHNPLRFAHQFYPPNSTTIRGAIPKGPSVVKGGQTELEDKESPIYGSPTALVMGEGLRLCGGALFSMLLQTSQQGTHFE